MVLRIWLSMVFTLMFGGAVSAQSQDVWIQISANRSLAAAEDDVRRYAQSIDNIYGFAFGQNWYAVAAGPYDPAAGQAELNRLLANGLVPRDAYLSDGAAYGEIYYPVGVLAPVRAPLQPQELTLAPEAAPEAVLETAEPIAIEPEETEREARAAERALSRPEREALQIAMQWFGHYTSAIDGDFGAGTRRAMAAFQDQIGAEATGVLSTRQRATLLQMYEAAQAALGLELITDAVAGIQIEAPLGLVQFDRYEAPFAHYGARDGSGVRMILISQPGDRGTMNGLFEILQTLEDVPPEGPRSKARDGFSITGMSEAFTSETRVRLEDGHLHGFMLIWPPEQAGNIGRVLPRMEGSLASVGAPMALNYGFDPAEQSVDLLAGLTLRRPDYSRSGFFVDDSGKVLTTATLASGCERLTIDQLYDARVAHVDADLGVALLTPVEPLSPMSVAHFAPSEARLRGQIAVGGFPFEGVLGAATLTFGTLEDIKGLGGETDQQRLSVVVEPGDQGGPVFDETGAVTGLLLAPPATGQILPRDVALTRKAAALREMLRTQGVAAATAEADAPRLAPEDLTLQAAEMTVLVSCWN